MLTGDKQNTAIQIALSCNFISPGRCDLIHFLNFLLILRNLLASKKIYSCLIESIKWLVSLMLWLWSLAVGEHLIRFHTRLALSCVYEFVKLYKQSKHIEQIEPCTPKVVPLNMEFFICLPSYPYLNSYLLWKSSNSEIRHYTFYYYPLCLVPTVLTQQNKSF